jgi:hypothetical protein
MKATIDVPDALYRRVKARAAMDGRAIREVTIELYEAWLGDQKTAATAASVELKTTATRPPMTGSAWLARWQALGEETAHRAIDPRPTSEILLSERR